MGLIDTVKETFENTADRFRTVMFGRSNKLDEPEVSTVATPGVDTTIDLKNIMFQGAVEDAKLSALMNRAGTDYHLYEALFNTLRSVLDTKDKYIKLIDEIKDYDFVESLINDITEDSLHKYYDPVQGPFFKVELLDPGYNERFQESLQEYLDSLDFHNHLTEITEEFLLYGEYIFKYDKESKEIDNGLHQSSFTPLFSKNKIMGVFNSESSTFHDVDNFIIINYKSKNRRTDFKSKSGSFFYTKTPRGLISVGLAEKIQMIRILEALIPIVELMKIEDKTIYHMRVPPGETLVRAYEKAESYKRIIKSLTGVEAPKSLDDVISRLGDPKIIPMFGNQSELSEKQFRGLNSIDTNKIDEIKRDIKSQLGITTDESGLTVNPKYLKLIRTIRLAWKDGISRILLAHCRNTLNLDITIKDILVTFPEVKGTNEIDSLDYLHIFASSVNDTARLISDAESYISRLSSSEYIEKDLVLEFFNKSLRPIVGTDMFHHKIETESTDNDTDTTDDFDTDLSDHILDQYKINDDTVDGTTDLDLSVDLDSTSTDDSSSVSSTKLDETVNEVADSMINPDTSTKSENTVTNITDLTHTTDIAHSAIYPGILVSNRNKKSYTSKPIVPIVSDTTDKLKSDLSQFLERSRSASKSRDRYKNSKDNE